MREYLRENTEMIYPLSEANLIAIDVSIHLDSRRLHLTFTSGYLEKLG